MFYRRIIFHILFFENDLKEIGGWKVDVLSVEYRKSINLRKII